MTRKTHEQMKAETIDKLISSARQAFFKKGYAATSMDELCANVGLTRGALYHHFGGKKGLLEAVVIQLNEEMVDALLRSTKTIKDPLKAFITALETYLELSVKPEIQRIVFQDAPAVLGSRLKEIDHEIFLNQLIDEVQSLLDKKIIKSVPAPSFAIMLNGAIMEGALYVANQKNKEDALKEVKKTLRYFIN